MVAHGSAGAPPGFPPLARSLLVWFSGERRAALNLLPLDPDLLRVPSLGLVSHFLDTGPVLSYPGLHFVHSDLGLSDGEPAHAGEPPLSGVVGCCAPTAL